MPRIDQRLDQVLVLRGVAALECDGSIPLESIGLERVDDQLVGPRLFPRWIDIFDAQEPFTAIGFRLSITGDCCQQ